MVFDIFGRSECERIEKDAEKMEITKVLLHMSSHTNGALAVADVTFDHQMTLKSFRIVNGKNGLFVSMPDRPMRKKCKFCQKKNPVGSKHCTDCGKSIFLKPPSYNGRPQFHEQLAYAITAEFHEELERAILEAYQIESDPKDADQV